MPLAWLESTLYICFSSGSCQLMCILLVLVVCLVVDRVILVCTRSTYSPKRGVLDELGLNLDSIPGLMLRVIPGIMLVGYGLAGFGSLFVCLCEFAWLCLLIW